MPVYVYKREGEDAYVEHFVHRAKDKPKTITCEDGVKANYDFAASMSCGHRAGLEAKLWPQESTSAGVRASQVRSDGKYKNPEARKKHPHHRFNPDTGDMVFNSKRQRRRQLDDVEMTDMNSYY